MNDPTVEIMCTQALEDVLRRVCTYPMVSVQGHKELKILAAEVTRARALQRFNNDRQIRLHLPVGA